MALSLTPPLRLVGSLGGWLRELAGSLAQAVLPPQCLACGQPCPADSAASGSVSGAASGCSASSLCSACQARWQPHVHPVRSGASGLAPLPLWAAATYEGSVRQALIAHKDHHDPRRVRALAALLAAAVATLLAQTPTAHDGGGEGYPLVSPALRGVTFPTPVVLVAAPSRAGTWRQRRADPVGLLAARAARLLRAQGLDVRAVRTGSLLAYTRAVADQSGLRRGQRRANLHGALRVRRLPLWSSTARAVVVDDIVTSGATAAEMVRALREAGLNPVGVASVAATPPRQ